MTEPEARSIEAGDEYARGCFFQLARSMSVLLMLELLQFLAIEIGFIYTLGGKNRNRQYDYDKYRHQDTVTFFSFRRQFFLSHSECPLRNP